MRSVIGLAAAVATAAGMLLVPGSAEAMESCAGKMDGWAKTNDVLDESVSPWFSTAKGVNYTRKIRFRALSGVEAMRCHAGTPSGERAVFLYSINYKLLECIRPGACKETGWQSYNDRTAGPVGNPYRYPNRAVGRDFFLSQDRTYPM